MACIWIHPFFYKQKLGIAIRDLEAYILADYILELVSAFNSYYNRDRFLVDDNSIRSSNLNMFFVLKKLFYDIITMLGGKPIERM